MASTLPSTFLVSLNLDRTSDNPLYHQIYRAFREAILDGQFEAGLRLPSSRDLAEMMDVSRHTVLNALEQLIAEGYLETRQGAGTYVIEGLPENYFRPRENKSKVKETTEITRERPLSRLGEAYARLAPRILSNSEQAQFSYNFAIGKPDLDIFPFELWARLSAKNYRYTPVEPFRVMTSAGYYPLREAIAEHLQIMRSVKCSPEQIIITQGTQQALFLIQSLLLERGDAFWLENPGYGAAYGALLTGGAQHIPVPVDENGLIVEAGIDLAPQARLAYITPSHQYPLGYMMSLSRRLDLLDWANKNNAWIVEDDYDSEFQYSGLPIAALQGLDDHYRVIYTGTFSKVLFPALRIGYIVLPPDLVDVFTAFRGMVDNASPLISQITLTDFMIEGHFTRHIRRMRKLYGEKRQVFLDACQVYLADKVDYFAAMTGMHITLQLPNRICDKAVTEQAKQYDVRVTPLSVYDFSEDKKQNGLVLGYTALPTQEIREGVKRLACAIDDSADS